MYSYANNSPTTFTDPAGLFVIDDGAKQIAKTVIKFGLVGDILLTAQLANAIIENVVPALYASASAPGGIGATIAGGVYDDEETPVAAAIMARIVQRRNDSANSERMKKRKPFALGRTEYLWDFSHRNGCDQIADFQLDFTGDPVRDRKLWVPIIRNILNDDDQVIYFNMQGVSRNILAKAKNKAPIKRTGVELEILMIDDLYDQGLKERIYWYNGPNPVDPDRTYNTRRG